MSFAKCSYRDCGNLSRDVSMFRFPVNDEGRLKLWILNSGNPQLDSLSNEQLIRRFICAVHFPLSSISRGNRRSKLLGPAVPIKLKCEHTGTSGTQPPAGTNTEGNMEIDITGSSPDHLKVEKPTKFYAKRTKTNTPVDGTLSTASPRRSRRYLFEQPRRRSRKCLFEEAQQADILGNHVGFTCNSCYGAILGFRYSCLECVDFDLCARCEAMREHGDHYMLRVPGPRPETEFKAMMADIRAALENRSAPSECEVQLKREPGSDDEDIKPIDPLNVPLEDTEPDGSGLGQDLLEGPTRPTEDLQGQPAPSTVGMMQQIPVLAVPSATHPTLAQSRQPTTIINPLVKETVRTQTPSAAQSEGKVKAATEKRKLTSDQGERAMVPLPFKMPKEEPLLADSGDTGDPTAAAWRGCASKEADFTVFTMQNKRDDDEEFDSGVS